jgi:hypothetical protein
MTIGIQSRSCYRFKGSVNKRGEKRLACARHALVSRKHRLALGGTWRYIQPLDTIFFEVVGIVESEPFYQDSMCLKWRSGVTVMIIFYYYFSLIPLFFTHEFSSPRWKRIGSFTNSRSWVNRILNVKKPNWKKNQKNKEKILLDEKGLKVLQILDLGSIECKKT